MPLAELPQCIHECAPPEIPERLSGIVRGAPQAVVGSLPEEVELGVWDVEGAGADVCGRECRLYLHRITSTFIFPSPPV